MIRDKIDFGSEVRYYDTNGKLVFTISKDDINTEDMDWDYSDIGDYYQNVVDGTRVSGKTFCEILNLKEKELNGENEEEEKDMNKVLQLYKERKIREITRKYNELVEKELESNTFINKYNTLVEEFRKNLEDLVVEDERENAGKKRVFIHTGYEMELPIDIDNTYEYYIRSKQFDKEESKEKNNLCSIVEEINAMLSMSDDKDYQIEVLQRYGIIDKKGKMSE